MLELAADAATTCGASLPFCLPFLRTTGWRAASACAAASRLRLDRLRAAGSSSGGWLQAAPGWDTGSAAPLKLALLACRSRNSQLGNRRVQLSRSSDERQVSLS